MPLSFISVFNRFVLNWFSRMEDDIFSIATEPINISNSNIYEEETQAILGAFDSPSILDESENRSQSNLSGSYCDGSPTQRLNHAEKEKYIGSYIVQTPEESKVHDVDSDCETIPASPVFDIDPIQEDIQMQRENISPFSSVKENFDPQPSASRSHGLGKPTRESKKVISNLSQEDEDSLCYPTQPLRKKKEIVASVDDSMDAPTQRLPQVRNLVTTAEGVSVDEPTQWLPDSTKSSILVADYGVKTPCQSPLERIEIETSMDAPTQKLPETKILVTMTEESSMDAPTQPLPHGRKALSECENSMDAPTQPLQHGRKMCALIDNENSLDAPTQPLREKRKAIVISDDGDSMDAVTQPLPKSQTRLRKQSFRATPRQTYDSDSEERPASPTLDLGLQLPLLKDKSDHLESPVLTVETDEETQRIDFDPQFLFDPCQAGALDSVSPVPFYGNTSLKHTNAASASSTPLQNKKKPPRGLAASPSRTSLDEQLSPHKTSVSDFSFKTSAHHLN